MNLKQYNNEELTKIKGIGRIKAIQIKALCELAIRMTTPSNYKKITVKKPEDIAKVFMEKMRFEKVE